MPDNLDVPSPGIMQQRDMTAEATVFANEEQRVGEKDQITRQGAVGRMLELNYPTADIEVLLAINDSRYGPLPE
ncbi:MAG: hypothetical protein NTV70_05745 [Acidobacteria bacterium]|nr:hypothetical protein [Acidobacteriota bacterium]